LGSVEHDLYSGDFNGDAFVNHFDLALWLAHKGSALGDSDYDLTYDLNADSRIDGLDVDLLMSRMYQPLVRPAAATGPDALAEGSLSNRAEGLESTTANAADSAIAREGEFGRNDEFMMVDELFATDPLWSIS